MNIQLYVKVPAPLGLEEPLPSKITLLPTMTVRSAPGSAIGSAGLLRNVHCNLEKSNGTVGSTRMVKVFALATWLFAGAGLNFSVSSPGAKRIAKGFRLVAVAVTESR